MITVADRTRRALKDAKKDFWFVVLLYALSFCLMGQMVLGFYSFYESHRGVAGDEVSIFVDSALSEKEIQAVKNKITKIAPKAELREVEPKDVLEEDILKLVGKKNKIPLILAAEFSVDTNYSFIFEAVKSIETVKGVEAVTANFEWIKKRYSLREAIAFAILSFGVPSFLLVTCLIMQNVYRLNSFMKEDQSLLLMLGGSLWPVRGPAICATFLASLWGCVFGALLLALTTYVTVPFIEEAFEINLMPTITVNILIYLSLCVGLMSLSTFCAFILAGTTKPKTL